jgi:BirA family biotin operon repressor/biotin-[acetyl-CoA-carboxylase] ligase
MSAESLQQQQIHASLTTRTFGRNLVILPQTGSTNDVAKGMAAQGAPEGTVVVTDEQTAGRGRLDRQWLAPPRTCLLCSVLFRPSLQPSQVHQLTMVCSLAAADAVLEVTELEVGLKWPNDLVVAASPAGPYRKLAGILTETGMVGERVDFAVVGIGLNVNVPGEQVGNLAPEATSILAETGQRTSRETLLVTLLVGIEERYAALGIGEGPHQEWTARLVTLGRQVEAVSGRTVLRGLAEGVDESGALLLRTSDGTLHHLAAGDVTLR